MTNIPCETCIHSKVCRVKEQALQVEQLQDTTFLSLELKCKEYKEKKLQVGDML